MSLNFDQLQAGIQFKVKEASYLVAAINETNGAKFAILVPALTEKELRNRNNDKDFIFHKEQYLQWNSKHQSNWFSKVTPRYFDFENVLILKSSEDQLLNTANLYANDYHWYNDNQENVFKNINEQSLINTFSFEKKQKQIIKSDYFEKINLRGETIIISTDEKNNLIIFEQVFSNINGKSMCFAVKNSDFKKILNWKFESIHNSREFDYQLLELLSELEIYKVAFVDSNTTEITNVNIKVINYSAVEKAENFETKTFFINKSNKNVVNLENNNIKNFIKLFKKIHWPNNPWLTAAADLKVKVKDIELFDKNIVNLSQLVIAEIETLNQNWKKNKYFVSLSEINEYSHILARLLAQYDQINSILDLNRDKIFSYQELIKPLLTTTDFAIDTLITKDNKQNFTYFVENLTKLEVANEKLITIVTGKNYNDHIENFDKRQGEYHIIKALVNDILIAKNKNIKINLSIIVKIWRIIKKVCYYLRNLKFSKKIAANDEAFKAAKQLISLRLQQHNSLENEKNLDLLNNNQDSSIAEAICSAFNKESCNSSLNSTPTTQVSKMLVS